MSRKEEMDSFYIKISSMSLMDYMYSFGYDLDMDFAAIPESDYPYLGLNQEVVAKLVEWNQQVQVWHHQSENEGMDEPRFPELTRRIMYRAAK